MIDPARITDYGLDDFGLEEQLIFWVCVIGSNADTVASRVNTLVEVMRAWSGTTPMEAIAMRPGKLRLADVLRRVGIRWYTMKAEALNSIAHDIHHSRLDLRTCTVGDLESYKGVGPKTARCFLLHTRPEARYAGLDRHVLTYLRKRGYDVPVSTPSSQKRYREIEHIVLALADASGMTPAQWDLNVWKTVRAA